MFCDFECGCFFLGGVVFGFFFGWGKGNFEIHSSLLVNFCTPCLLEMEDITSIPWLNHNVNLVIIKVFLRWVDRCVKLKGLMVKSSS